MSSDLRVPIQHLTPDLPSPSYAHPTDAGLDLHAAAGMTLKPGERALIPTGVAVAIPDGYAGLVQPRSGLAWRAGLGLVNSPGLIDSGYRGEIAVIAINLDPEAPIEVRRGDRIAQMIIVPVAHAELVPVVELPPADRGPAGFGSTGISDRGRGNPFSRAPAK
ncbi:MAG: dUTP diphosphatase [Actinomycetota bacterium]